MTTTTPLLLSIYAVKDSRGNVLVYKDPNRRVNVCAFEHWRSDRPTRRNRWLTINCYRYRLVWLDTVSEGTQKI